jgi:hypothetical protein
MANIRKPAQTATEIFLAELGRSTGCDPYQALRELERDALSQREWEMYEEMKRTQYEIMQKILVPPAILGPLLPRVDWSDYAEPAEPKPPLDLKKLKVLEAAEPHKVGPRVPDRIEPITGWRAWRVERSDPPVLKALGQDTLWLPKKALKAVCSGRYDDRHQAPLKFCECGIWAFNDMKQLVPALSGYENVDVVGEVSLWGKVIECANGYRAQFAYPAELWLFDNALEELGYIYGIPVRTT